MITLLFSFRLPRRLAGPLPPHQATSAVNAAASPQKDKSCYRLR